MNTKLAIGFFTKDGQAPFTDKVTAILQKMTGNPNFSNPTPGLSILQTAFDAYKVATVNAAQGGVQNTFNRDARRAELVALLRQLASFVSLLANGDMSKLASSGFPVQKQSSTPVGPLPAPNAPRVTQGMNSGTLNAAASPVYGAASYNWSIALQSSPDVAVQTAVTTGARTSFSGLTPGQVYLICLNAVGAAGLSDWSDYGSLMVI
jgi:hypothetical protein